MTSVVAIMSVFTLAVCFIMIGSVSEELKVKLTLTNSDIGTLMFAMSLTSLIVQLLAGPLVDTFGHKPLAIVGFLVSSASIFLLGMATSLSMAVGAAVLLGVGAICCNTVGNTLLPVVLFDGKEPSRASNFGNAFVGLAFVLTPLAVVTLINDLHISFEQTMTALALLIFLFALCACVTTFPQVSTGFEIRKAVALLSQPLVLLAALALVCYIGLEFSLNTWIKPLMKELYEAQGSTNAIRNAGRVLALFGLSMAIGRFLTSMIKNLSQVGSRIIALGALIAVVSILLLSRTTGTGLAIVGVLITGLAFAPMFPTIVGVTFSKFNPGLYGSIFGIIFSIGLLGSMVLPKIIGMISMGKTVQQSLPIAAAISALLMVSALLMSRVAAQPPQGDHA
jgi:fucose permease